MHTPSILLIGCGPHAKRVYIPKLKEFEKEFKVKIKGIVELTDNKEEVMKFVSRYFANVNYIFTDKFPSKMKHDLPQELENELDRIVIEEKINAVIIATDPLNHM